MQMGSGQKGQEKEAGAWVSPYQYHGTCQSERSAAVDGNGIKHAHVHPARMIACIELNRVITRLLDTISEDAHFPAQHVEDPDGDAACGGTRDRVRDTRTAIERIGIVLQECNARRDAAGIASSTPVTLEGMYFRISPKEVTTHPVVVSAKEI